MAWVAAVVAGGAEAVKAYGAHKAKKQEEAGIREAGHRRMAAGTREVAEAEREKEFMHSRAIAVGAAGGAGLDNPGAVKILGDINAEGEYRVMSRLWSAQNDYDGLIYKADAAGREAKAIVIAGVVNALSAGTSAYFGAKKGSPTGGTAAEEFRTISSKPGGSEIPGFGVDQGIYNA